MKKLIYLLALCLCLNGATAMAEKDKKPAKEEDQAAQEEILSEDEAELT